MRIIGIVLLTSGLLLLLDSCGKNISYDSLHQSVIGTWTIDQVKLRQEGTVHRKDVTSHWDRYSFIFNYDETCTIIDSDTDTEYDGYWYIDEYWASTSSSSSDDERKQDLVFQVYDPNSEDYRTFRWKNAYASNHKLKGEERKNNAKYFFKLFK